MATPRRSSQRSSTTRTTPPRRPKAKEVWALTVNVNPEGDDAVSELLAGLTGGSTVSTHDKRTGRVTVVTYLEDRTFFSATRRREVAHGLLRIAACGLELGRPVVRWRKVPKADWTESWKKHFQPISVGHRLLVRPSWSHRRPVKGQVEVVLDPGLSFGTGQHPTTDFCLRELVRLRGAVGGAGNAMMDVGTGSGILAIVAAKLGYDPVSAFDFDPEAVDVARRNAADNGVSDCVMPKRRDVATLKAPRTGKWAVVCANLTADLLRRHASSLWAQVAPGGHLVLAGILAEEFEGICQCFEALGARRMRDRRKGEWRSGSFRKDA
ncbi:MAG: 50S ribosomal protein L11 methyltransferase [Verrucomicrobiales bacterium]|nr:50S ribosomal protein L11 methyltransferase [Verrucomicrobiales bacterium]